MKLPLCHALLSTVLALLVIPPACAQTDYITRQVERPETSPPTTPQTTPSGILSTVAGTGYIGDFGNGGPAIDANLALPSAVATDALGNIYIADPGVPMIRMVNAATGVISAFAGTGQGGYTGDGQLATAATLNEPTGVAIDSTGNVYIADTRNNVIRMVNTSGIISTVAGNGYGAGAGQDDLCQPPTDGVLATKSTLCRPTAIAVDPAFNLYIIDSANNEIRKVTKTTGIITTVAGSSSLGGYYGDGGLAINAGLGGPKGLAVDKSENIYIADTDDCAVRKVTHSTGIISSLVGSPNGFGGYNACWLGGDGGLATAASVSNPAGVAVDSLGNVYISDSQDNLIRIIVASTKKIYTVAGINLPSSPYSGFQSEYEPGTGPGTYIVLNTPAGLALDPSGNLIIADSMNSVVRKLTYPSVLAASAPVISPAMGSALYTEAEGKITMTAPKGATIYYTLDGTIPTTSSTKYTAPIYPAKSAMVTAFDTVPGASNSQVNIATFFIGDSPTLSTGDTTLTITKPVTVTMSDPDYPGTIYYTVDGQSPDHSQPDAYVYKAPITISGTSYLQAVTELSVTDFDGNVFTTFGPPTGVNITLAKAPVVLTSPATTITASGAVLNGSVNPLGVKGTYWFEYGTDYCATTKSTTAVAYAAGAVAVPESVTLTGLAANQQYCFAMVAKSAWGTTTSEITFFYTN